MRITRLYLRNYRVYEDPVELAVPPGLVGVFGRNGAGKSTLLESITWTLFGRARTGKELIRTSGINADCVTEVEFEHEGHLYLVRRTIAGQNHTVKAQAQADGAQVAEGVRDTTRYVHSVLGMDDVAFRASVFAEQKQLAAFSSHQPAERRRLVMQLLGITPLDGARDQARRDAKAAVDQLGRLRTLLPDRAVLATAIEEARAVLASSGEGAEVTAAAAAEAELALMAGQSAYDVLSDTAREYEALVRDGKALRSERDATGVRVDRLTTELAGLQGAADSVAELATKVDTLEAAEAALVGLERVAAADRALAAAPRPEPVAAPDEAACEAARRAAEEAGRRAAELSGQLAAARAQLDRARELAGRSDALSAEADCPLCGQALGQAFDRVREHRRHELDGAGADVARLADEHGRAAREADQATAASDREAAALAAARRAWEGHRVASERHRAAEEAHRAALAALGRAWDPGEVDAAREAVAGLKRDAAELARLRGRLERRPVVEEELAAEQGRLLALDGELANLRDKVRALGFEPERLAAAREELEARRRVVAETAAATARAAAERAAAEARLEAAQQRLADAEEQHSRLAEAEEEARHLGRLADLLNGFRNTVVASVGPRLSLQAADLFAELTDREYDRLEVDPDTYEIQIRDGGISYGMDRYSGSEADLANLALRVAISEQVRFQSGGVVGLLVLDEVFGPLDEDRKERMLLALERLRARFRQVLVVTHASEIKEQLPGAIEVVKLPGRRATARVVNG